MNKSSCVLFFLIPFCMLQAELALGQGRSEDSTTVGALSIYSTPSDADVFVDGKMVGRTPFDGLPVAAGPHVICVSKTGYCEFCDSIALAVKGTVQREVYLDSACGLIVRSMPDSASVYLDNVYMGRSPLRLTDIHPGWKSLRLTKQNWAIWDTRVLSRPGMTDTVKAEMQSKFGAFTLEVYSQDVEVSIDGKSAGRGSLTDYMIPAGRHDVLARRIDTPDSVRETVTIMPGGNVQWEARFGEPSRKAIWYSLVVPGLGQIMDGSTEEGFELLGGFAASCLLAVAANVQYQDHLGQYNDALDHYRTASSEDAAKSAGDRLSATYDKLKSPYQLRSAGMVAAGVFYLYSLAEAIISHSHSSVNRMSPLTLDANHRITPGIVYAPTGCKVAVHVTF